MGASITVVVPGSAGGLKQLADGFAAFSAANRLPESAVWPIQVALDELVSNTVKYGYGGREEPGRIEVLFHLDHRVLEIAILDDAAPFNPLDAPEPDTTAGVHDRPLGGLGIHLVRKMVDRVEYERVGERNCLRLSKRVED